MTIGRRLTLAFGSLALVIAVGAAVTGAEFVASLRQARTLTAGADRVMALYRVERDLGDIRRKLDNVTNTRDAALFSSTAHLLRQELFDDIEQALAFFRETGTPVPGTLSALRDTISDQLEAMQRLVDVNDWTAITLRLDGQVEGILNSVKAMVERVNADVSDQRIRASLEIEAAQRRAQVILGFTALASLVIAVALGLYVTRSIVVPLAELEAAALQFAKGDFNVSLNLRSNDELAEVSRAFTVAGRQLHDYYSALKRSNEALEQFAYAASHDLQEPLRTISSFSELLKRKYGTSLTSEAKQYLSYLSDASTQMQKLVAGILEYSRLTTLTDQQEESVETEDIVRSVLKYLHAAIQQTHAVITHDPLPAVMGSGPQLVRLFQNLIGNAIKYGRDDTPPWVQISAQEDGEMWRFCIQDNGMGIDPKYHEQVFKMFKQLERGGKGGVGLGLAISKRIVERHGGRIWLVSAVNQGSRFYFTLRRATPRGQPQHAGAEPDHAMRHS
ncbi:MAG: HAMP domain-containing protein [Acidobacteriaceae bacterium]|nr:HAMP domain-containing protein [Acidobacteriaceae bacterium]MBV9780896.1 HAMP domain-containing protein [Acidobacteriaceae bacterium]